MPLQLQDDEVAALEAALSFADDFEPPAVDGALVQPQSALEPAEGGEMAEDDELQLDAELDRLLLAALSPSPSSSSGHEGDDAPMIEAAPSATSTIELPPVLPPLVANLSTSAVRASAAQVSTGGRVRRGSRAVGESRTVIAKTKRRVKVNPNRARNERKNELAYLRTMVEQMETQLDALRHHRRTRGTGNAAASSSVVNTGIRALFGFNHSSALASASTPSIWRDIATRQQGRLEKVERENTRLKLVLESQVKLAKSMETLLQRRARQVVGCSDMIGPQDGDHPAGWSSQGRTLDFLVDKDTYEALLTSVETAYADLDAVFAINGLSCSETPCSDARMREGASGMYLDVFSNKLMPFEFEAVTTAVWNHFRGNEKHRGMVYENATKNLETSSDTIMEAFTMEFLGKDMNADFRVKQVVRRYVEADQQVVVWVSIGQALDHDTSPFSSFGLVDKGYVVTKKPTSPTLVNGDFTLVQMCSLVSPQMAAGRTLDLTAAGDFTEFVLNVVAANTTTSQELIENVLLDQALQKQQRQPAGA
ncbi:hypothetical protein BBJ28_00010524 [Nothophytophthora sp. Chile5]|nr:hypothetical protein BBJ28_00010524 [Nothophytophthora sp. Chile5]